MAHSGILKNKLDHDKEQHIKLAESTKEFREQVLKNTKLNALLKKDFDPSKVDNHELDKLLLKNSNLSSSTDQDNEKEKDDRLKWNNKNLNDNEILQKEIIENLKQSIDEPKTPFQKAQDPQLNEYYQDDNEDVDELEEFDLGEPAENIEDAQNRRKDLYLARQPTNESESEPESHQSSKKSFAELRKMHYHHEHIPVSKKNYTEDDDDDDDDDDDSNEVDDEDDDDDTTSNQNSKPKKSFAEMRKLHYAYEHPPLGKKFINNDDE